MAFSMFLRNSVCRSPAMSQQLLQMSAQRTIQRSLTSTTPIVTNVFKDMKITPILNSVRSFRTTSSCLSGEKAHDHARLWVIEKATSAVLVPLVPLGLLFPNKLVDMILAVLITAHAFWGLEAIAVDYVRATLFGPILPKIAIGFVYAFCIATLGGLFYLISHDIGLCNSIRQFWAIKSEQKA